MRAVLPACRAEGDQGSSPTWARRTRSPPPRRRARSPASCGLSGLGSRPSPATTCSRRSAAATTAIEETGGTLADLGDRLVSANAYLGASPIVEALRRRRRRRRSPAASPTRPCSWRRSSTSSAGRWTTGTRLGRGTLAGHLLECAGQVTGGYFADPGAKDVPGLARLGFPIGEVGEDGSVRDHQGRRARAGAVTLGHRARSSCSTRSTTRPATSSPTWSPTSRGVTVAEVGPGPGAGRGRRGRPKTGTAEGLGRLPRRLRRRGPDLLRRPERGGARPARPGDRRASGWR